MSELIDLFISREQEEFKARKINGVVVGLVTQNTDPDKLGRVKITFPWLSDNNETEWTRISTLMAGSGRGSFFIPEVNDEVLVAFEHGDLNRPVVIGTLWSKEDKPPAPANDEKNNIRKITSRRGHEIIFDDDDDLKGRVEVHTKSGHKLILDDDFGKEKVTIKDKTEMNSIEIDSVSNSVSIKSQMNISIKATNIEIESTGMMTIKAGAILTVSGSLVKIN